MCHFVLFFAARWNHWSNSTDLLFPELLAVCHVLYKSDVRQDISKNVSHSITTISTYKSMGFLLTINAPQFHKLTICSKHDQKNRDTVKKWNIWTCNDNFATEQNNRYSFYALAGSSFHVRFQWTLRQLSVVLLQTPQGKDNPTAEPSVCLLLYLLLSDWQGHIYWQQAEVAHVLLPWHALPAHALYIYLKRTEYTANQYMLYPTKDTILQNYLNRNQCNVKASDGSTIWYQ